MKKLLLLSSLALCFSAAQAQSTKNVSDLFTSATNWGGVTMNGTTISFTKNYTGIGYANWSSIDVSKYASVTAVLANPTGDIIEAQVFVQYVEDVSVEGDKNTTNDESGYLELPANAETTITVNLKNTNGWNAWQVMIQNKAGLKEGDDGFAVSTVELKEFYFTEALSYEPAQELTITDGSKITGTQFAGFSDNAKIEFTFEVSGDYSYYNGWGIGAICDASWTGVKNITCDGTAELVVTTTVAEIKTAIESGTVILNLYGQSKDGKKVSLTAKSATIANPTALRPITTNAQVISTDYFNLAGVKSSTPQKGLNIAVRTLSNGSKVTEKLLVK